MFSDRRLSACFLMLIHLLCCAGHAFAEPISWVQWTENYASAAPKTGSLTIGNTLVDVTFHTNNESYSFAYTNLWGYGTLFENTYRDNNVVDNGPPWGNVQVFGGNLELYTVTFSKPVINPTMSIYSLGNGQMFASYNFFYNEYGWGVPSFVSGGPSTGFAGQPISVSWATVWGAEGNGTVIFPGIFTSLSWQIPIYDNWSGFTIGAAGVFTVTPEPQLVTLVAFASIGVFGLFRYCRDRR